jgi:hypothetical protein
MATSIAKKRSDEVDVHPAAVFITYLIVTGAALDRESLNVSLKGLGFAAISDAGYRNIKEQIPLPPDDFDFTDESHTPSVRYLRQLKIYNLCHQDDTTRQAIQLLSRHALRLTVETLLLGKNSPREIAHRISKDLKEKDISGPSITEFRFYFWNSEAMTIQNWSDYFGADSGGRTGIIHPLDTRTVLFCPPSVSIDMVGLKQRTDRQEVLEDVFQSLYTMFLQVKSLPMSKDKVEMLEGLTRGLLRTDDRLRSSDTALQETLRRFERFKVKTDSTEIPSLADLAPAGTVSGMSQGEVMRSRRAP